MSFNRITRHGLTCGSSRRAEESDTSPTRVTTLAGKSTLTRGAYPTPSTSSCHPTWTTWRKTPSCWEDELQLISSWISCEGGPFFSSDHWQERSSGGSEPRILGKTDVRGLALMSKKASHLQDVGALWVCGSALRWEVDGHKAVAMWDFSGCNFLLLKDTPEIE